MKLTDGKKTIEITMQEWDGKQYKPDWSNDFFESGSLPKIWIAQINENAHKVEDVDYCIEQAKDWANYQGDFYDPETQETDKERGIERIVSIDIF